MQLAPRWSAFVALLVLAGVPAMALDTVTITSQFGSTAYEANLQPGLLYVSRAPGSIGNLAVRIQVGGTATLTGAGKDLDFTTTSTKTENFSPTAPTLPYMDVTIPDGSTGVYINVVPVHDGINGTPDEGIIEGAETVDAQVIGNGGLYIVGQGPAAKVTIADEDVRLSVFTIDDLASENSPVWPNMDNATFLLSLTKRSDNSLFDPVGSTVSYAIDMLLGLPPGVTGGGAIRATDYEFAFRPNNTTGDWTSTSVARAIAWNNGALGLTVVGVIPSGASATFSTSGPNSIISLASDSGPRTITAISELSSSSVLLTLGTGLDLLTSVETDIASTGGAQVYRGTGLPITSAVAVRATSWILGTKALTIQGASFAKDTRIYVENDTTLRTIQDVSGDTLLLSSELSPAAVDAVFSSGGAKIYLGATADRITTAYIDNHPSFECVVVPVQDLVAEGAEVVGLSVFANSNYQLSNPTAGKATIADDDVVASIRTISNASEPTYAGSAVIELKDITGALINAPKDITLIYRVGAGVDTSIATPGTNSAAGEDYTATGLDPSVRLGQITVPTGQNSAFISINPLADERGEGNESVTITLAGSYDYSLSSTGGGSENNPSTVVNIADSRGAVYINGATNGYEAPTNPGLGSFDIRINRGAGVVTGPPVAIAFTVSGTLGLPGDAALSTTTAGAVLNYDAFAKTGTITIPLDALAASVVVTPADDQIREGDEQIVLTLQTGQGYTISSNPNQAFTETVTVIDDEPVVSLAFVQHAIEAGQDGLVRASYPVGPNNSLLNRSLTIPFTLGGTATQNIDYTISSLTFPPGVNSVDLPISALDDGVLDPGETVTVTLSPPSTASYALGTTSTASVTITDGAPTITISAGAGPQETGGADGSLGSAGSFVITSDRTLSRNITVSFAVTGTAQSAPTWTSGVRYQTLTGSATIPAGSTTISVPVMPFNDNIPNPGATVIATLGSGTSYILGATTAATLTITDNDIDPNLAIPFLVSSPDPDGVYVAGQTIRIQVTWSQDVLVSGSPGLNLSMNGITRRAVYAGGNKTYGNGSRGGDVLTWTYTIDSADFSADLDLALPAVLTLDSGSQINDLSGAPASLALPAPGAPNSLAGTKSLVIRGVNGTVEAPDKPSSAMFAVPGDNGSSCGKGIGAIFGGLMLMLVLRRRRA